MGTCPQGYSGPGWVAFTVPQYPWEAPKCDPNLDPNWNGMKRSNPSPSKTIYGADGGIRTPDPLVTKQPLTNSAQAVTCVARPGWPTSSRLPAVKAEARQQTQSQVPSISTPQPSSRPAATDGMGRAGGGTALSGQVLPDLGELLRREVAVVEPVTAGAAGMGPGLGSSPPF